MNAGRHGDVKAVVYGLNEFTYKAVAGVNLTGADIFGHEPVHFNDFIIEAFFIEIALFDGYLKRSLAQNRAVADFKLVVVSFFRSCCTLQRKGKEA